VRACYQSHSPCDKLQGLSIIPVTMSWNVQFAHVILDGICSGRRLPGTIFIACFLLLDSAGDNISSGWQTLTELPLCKCIVKCTSPLVAGNGRESMNIISFTAISWSREKRSDVVRFINHRGRYLYSITIDEFNLKIIASYVLESMKNAHLRALSLLLFIWITPWNRLCRACNKNII
jgi:hypothetical protein